jgi:hypothetical protein
VFLWSENSEKITVLGDAFNVTNGPEIYWLTADRVGASCSEKAGISNLEN